MEKMLYIVRGIPGSGKSTFAKSLGGTHFETDMFFMVVGVDGNGLSPYSITEIVHMMDKRMVMSEINEDHHLDDIVNVVG